MRPHWQVGCYLPDSVDHIIVCLFDRIAVMPADAGNEAGSGRVYDNILNPSPSCQFLQCQIILFIGQLPVLLSAVPVVFPDTIPVFRHAVALIVQVSRHAAHNPIDIGLSVP